MTIPPSSPLEEKILEFRKKFVKTISIQGEDIEIVDRQPKEVEQFISEVIAEVRQSESKGLQKFTATILNTAFKTITPWKIRESDKDSHHAYFEGWNDCIKEIKKNRIKYLKFINSLSKNL